MFDVLQIKIQSSPRLKRLPVCALLLICGDRLLNSVLTLITLAGLLKLFIRELKPPIVPYNSYLDFILVEGTQTEPVITVMISVEEPDAHVLLVSDNEALQADNKAKCARYQELILRLPTVNRCVRLGYSSSTKQHGLLCSRICALLRDALRYLLDFLSRVASHSATNKVRC